MLIIQQSSMLIMVVVVIADVNYGDDDQVDHSMHSVSTQSFLQHILQTGQQQGQMYFTPFSFT